MGMNELAPQRQADRMMSGAITDGFGYIRLAFVQNINSLGPERLHKVLQLIYMETGISTLPSDNSGWINSYVRLISLNFCSAYTC